MRPFGSGRQGRLKFMATVVPQKRVGILVTGETEYYGMAIALQRLFPAHLFDCLPVEKKFLPGTKLYSGFTSSQLSREHVQNPPEACLNLVAFAAQEAIGDRHKEAYDLVIILDDLEICNAHQPELVSEVMRMAVHKHLEVLATRNARIQDLTKQSLKEKVSFHLVAPMIEAWFFIDNKALRRAGVQSLESVSFNIDSDPESFSTDDQAFLAAEAAFCTALAKQPPGRRKKNKPKWIDNENRCRHPKGYLQWLTSAPEHRNCTNYQESSHGADALREFDWNQVPMRHKDHLGYLKAMVEDLEQVLGSKPVVDLGSPANISTAIAVSPRDRILRNI